MITQYIDDNLFYQLNFITKRIIININLDVNLYYLHSNIINLYITEYYMKKIIEYICKRDRFLLILLLNYKYKIKIIFHIFILDINNKSILINNQYNKYHFTINFYGNDNYIKNIKILNIKKCKITLYNLKIKYYPIEYYKNRNFKIINKN